MKGILVNIILICSSYEFFGRVSAATVTGKSEICKAEGWECTSNTDCCSEFCDKDRSEKFGVCKRACGTTVSNLVQSNDGQTEYGDFPWHAGIYEYNSKYQERGVYTQFCTGTLISHTAVVSAATCFVLENQVTVHGLYRTEKIYKKRLSNFKIGLGKYHRNINASEDDLAQILDVKSIEFAPSFEKSLRSGTDLNFTQYEALNYPLFSDEIVIITLKTEVEYTRAVRPICVDVGPYNSEKGQVIKGSTAKFSCWGDNQTLELVDMNYVPRGECGNKITSSYYGYLSAQKICVSPKSDGCRLSVGGGLVFEDQKTKTYYLRGVNTVAHGLTGTVPFTKISSQRDLVEKYLDDCKRVCRQTCGITASKLNQPLCSNGNEIEYGEFPWHAGIYMYNATLGYYDLFCGGTLISHKVVISAAHCFKTTNNMRSEIYTKEPSILKVALGKYHRNLYDPRDALAQIVDVEYIEYSPEFIRMEANDIAILTLKSGVKFTKAVQPVCIDTDPDRFEREQLKKGATGMIVGWDVKRPEFDDPVEETGEITPQEKYDSTSITEKIREIPKQTELRDMPTLEVVRIVPIEECVAGELQYISKDVVCGNKTSKDRNVYYAGCKNYLGRGLVFQDPKTKKYFLRGVASLTGFVCAETDFFPYTKLSFHKDLVEKYQDDCEGGCRRNLCEPLTSKKLHMICLSPYGQSTRCDKPLPSNSKVIFACNSVSYMEIKRSKYNVINCKNGQWDRPLLDDFCVPAYAECGKPVPSNLTQPVVKNGKETKYGDFPWHAGIYEYDSQRGSYEQICGGTLISHKVVVSAAHCFETDIKSRHVNTKDLSTLKIGLGKYRRTLNATDDVLAQIFDVEHIEMPQEYLSSLAQWTSDIAFVTLKTQVEYTRAVLPVCIDVGPNNMENDQLIKGAMGKIVGWGLTAGNEASEELLLAEMPFVTRNDCRNAISHGLVGYLRGDKICAGDKLSNVTVCTGDSGGGLVFEDSETKVYYLRGVVSLGPKGCKAPDYSLFTRLSSHKELLEKYLRL